MKILLVANVPTAAIAKDLGMGGYYGGGWIEGLINNVDHIENIDFEICFPYNCINAVVSGHNGRIKWYAIPYPKPLNIKPVNYVTKPDRRMYKSIEEIMMESKPDILHIFGTELVHSYVAAKVFNNPQKTLVHLQGILTYCLKNFYANIPWYVKNRIGFADLVKGNIKSQYLNMKKRSVYERKLLSFVENVAGRTDWDFTVSKILGKRKLKYHSYNETMRNEFYNNTWNIDACEKHSIFFSAATTPLKGLHFMIEAMKYIIQDFPDALLYIAGNKPRKMKFGKFTIPPLKTSYYRYLEALIKKYNLMKNIIFTGSLDEKQMCHRFLKSNVFVCSSSIENSSNSIAEAMLLGVPTVASDVGGTKNLLIHEEDGFLFPVNEPYMISFYVKKIFQNNILSASLSENSIAHAKKTHSREENTKKILDIYNNVFYENE